MKIFISQPMNGKDEKDILQNMQKIFEDFKEYNEMVDPLPADDCYILIDNYHKEGIPEDAGRLAYLGDSISKMSDADIIIFAPGWERAKGCAIEMEIARTYDILYTIYRPSSFSFSHRGRRCTYFDHLNSERRDYRNDETSGE